MLQYLVEFIGTFIFLLVIFITSNPFAVGATLTGLKWIGSKLGSSHFNPAVSLFLLLNNRINNYEFVGQISSQLLAALSAYLYYKYKN